MPKYYSKKRGGGGATEFGVNAAGGFNPQAVTSPNGGTSNMLQYNAQPNCMRGGKRGSKSIPKRINTMGKEMRKEMHKEMSKEMRQGGTTMMDIAIPAALFAANQMYRPKSSTVSFRRGSRSNKFNRTRRMSSRRR